MQDVAERDPDRVIRDDLRTGRLQGWHLERRGGETIEVPGLAPWHAEALGMPKGGTDQ